MIFQGDAGREIGFPLDQRLWVRFMHDSLRKHLFPNMFQRLLAGAEMNTGANKQLAHKSSL